MARSQVVFKSAVAFPVVLVQENVRGNDLPNGSDGHIPRGKGSGNNEQVLKKGTILSNFFEQASNSLGDTSADDRGGDGNDESVGGGGGSEILSFGVSGRGCSGRMSGKGQSGGVSGGGDDSGGGGSERLNQSGNDEHCKGKSTKVTREVAALQKSYLKQ